MGTVITRLSLHKMQKKKKTYTHKSLYQKLWEEFQFKHMSILVALRRNYTHAQATRFKCVCKCL